MVEQLYSRSIIFIQKGTDLLIPFLRRIIRFFALPYCYSKLINWDECKISGFQVAKDLLYIFFKLKYFPDNYSPCRLWEKDRKIWPLYYGSIYNPYPRGRLRKEVQPKQYLVLFENKRICYQLCKGANLPLPKEFGLVYPEEDYRSFLDTIFKNEPQLTLIIKPNLGKGGHGILLAKCEEGTVYIQEKNTKVPLDVFHLPSPSVVQEYIQQHDKLNKISPSTNTVRIITILTQNKNVIIVGAYMRFGLGNAFLDNMCVGGVGVGVNVEQGNLKELAYDLYGRPHKTHPTSGITFHNFQVPLWPEIVSLVTKTQQEFSFYKLLGHDIAITNNGPVIIEINESPDNIAMEMTYGPILQDENVRREFRRYNLLINNCLKE